MKKKIVITLIVHDVKLRLRLSYYTDHKTWRKLWPNLYFDKERKKVKKKKKKKGKKEKKKKRKKEKKKKRKKEKKKENKKTRKQENKKKREIMKTKCPGFLIEFETRVSLKIGCRIGLKHVLFWSSGLHQLHDKEILHLANVHWRSHIS